MPAKAGMTAMDGGNAVGLHGATLAHYEDACGKFSNHCAIDPVPRAHCCPE
jgi:hypothetical protein